MLQKKGDATDEERQINFSWQMLLLAIMTILV